MTNVLIIIYQLIVIAAIIHVVMGNRQPVKTIAWALVIYFVPVVGIVLYLFLGIDTRKERMANRRSIDQLTKRSMFQYVQQRDLVLPDESKPLIDLFINQSFSLPFHQNSVKLQTSGYEFFPLLLKDIASAKSHIHIGVYIFEDDALGRLMADALKDKARSGIEVRIIYDAVGCFGVDHSFFEDMRKAGIEVEPFMPVRFPKFARRANYRDHRKMIVIDGRVGYIGGMNIALRYVKGIEAKKRKLKKDIEGCNWRDTMARIEGMGVCSLQRAFLIDWYFVDQTLLSDHKYYEWQTEKAIGNDETRDVVEKDCNCLMQTVTSDPVSPYPEIMQGYVMAINAARRSVMIETPYFLPTEVVFFALKTAAARGVDVKVMVPLHGDARITELATRSYLREAAASGITVLLYKGGFLHSKLMTVDDILSTCGSTNIDFRSFENNFEANAFFYDSSTAIRIREIFEADARQSLPFEEVEELSKPSFVRKLAYSLARLFSPLL